MTIVSKKISKVALGHTSGQLVFPTAMHRQSFLCVVSTFPLQGEAEHG